jgi:hypothetical protein
MSRTAALVMLFLLARLHAEALPVGEWTLDSVVVTEIDSSEAVVSDSVARPPFAGDVVVFGLEIVDADSAVLSFALAALGFENSQGCSYVVHDDHVELMSDTGSFYVSYDPTGGIVVTAILAVLREEGGGGSPTMSLRVTDPDSACWHCVEKLELQSPGGNAFELVALSRHDYFFSPPPTAARRMIVPLRANRPRAPHTIVDLGRNPASSHPNTVHFTVRGRKITTRALRPATVYIGTSRP